VPCRREAAGGEDEPPPARPARYVVDQDRRIGAAEVNPDYTIRPELGDTVAVVRQLQAARSKAARHEERHHEYGPP